jgi:hypothetical protein
MVLSVGPDPAAVQDDTVQLVAEKVQETESRLEVSLQRLLRALNQRAKN